MPETNTSLTMPRLNLAVGMATPGHLSKAATSQSRLPELPPPPLLASAGSPRPAPPRTTVLDGQRLRELRRERGLSQERLADRAGMSLTTVARLEGQARASCRGRTLGRLAAAPASSPPPSPAPSLTTGRRPSALQPRRPFLRRRTRSRKPTPLGAGTSREAP